MRVNNKKLEMFKNSFKEEMALNILADKNFESNALMLSGVLLSKKSKRSRAHSLMADEFKNSPSFDIKNNFKKLRFYNIVPTLTVPTCTRILFTLLFRIVIILLV